MTARNNQMNNRRDFIKLTSAAAVTGAVAFPHVVTGQGTPPILKIGLIGCGGRGSGAANQALSADPNVKLVAVADAFQHQADSALERFKKAHGDKVDVKPDHVFVGLDAYKKLIATDVDVVLLATPPGFRPIHLKTAVDAGKHIFCEKPMAVDGPGIRMAMEAARQAKEKSLALVAGFCWRYHNERRAAFEQIHSGTIGDVVSYYATYYTGPVKPMPPASRKPADKTDLWWQVANWYNFNWLCGDSLVEQAIHSVDKVAWAMKDVPPTRAVAVGGRQIPAEGGNIFDHFEVNYDFPGGVRAQVACRQQRGCHNENNDYISGTKGQCLITGGGSRITGDKTWRYQGPSSNMYQAEHDELFASIRVGQPKYDGDWMLSSTLMGLMGRMAAYTGKLVTWDMALNSKLDYAPDDMTWDTVVEPAPMAMPGKTKFV